MLISEIVVYSLPHHQNTKAFCGVVGTKVEKQSGELFLFVW
jgi:hypothetical protein